ncbi:hypothetical protein TRL7639_00540 [Falsiruegeria litorea R37]|uniref:DUF4166 domain-containing protein n=1 Tax=Falsiruegeria litorea R37 TaxID=1200284 RepID=A0A1Y5RRI1_9RHOB|nr:DUF4166 domain-containing protein [Falsiruegeria litorea]SLN20991.1 hypothetical protein TRL7639_00540 [Falsiruegeria litorea R37]
MTVLYRRVLGAALDDMPPQLQVLHGSADPRTWSGQAKVLRGAGMLSRLIGWVMRLPPQGDAVPVSVSFIPRDGGEVWQRDFAGHTFTSYQYQAPNAQPGIVQERFGMIDVTVALQNDGDRLALEPMAWAIGPLPLPRSLLPAGQSFEMQIEDRFVFDVEIAMPWVGRIAAYRGWLLPVE